jgi:hypothetical protein
MTAPATEGLNEDNSQKVAETVANACWPKLDGRVAEKTRLCLSANKYSTIRKLNKIRAASGANFSQ